MKEILVVGGVTYNKMIYLDQFPQAEPGTIFASHDFDTIGSTGAGKAFNLHQLGLPVRLHGFIGDDDYGQKIITSFKEKKINFTYDIDPKGTKRHVNLMDKFGRRISIYVAHGSHPLKVAAQKVKTLVENASLVCLNILPYCKDFIPTIKENKIPIWVDIHDYNGKDEFHRDFIEAADVIHFSSDKMPDYKPFMESLINNGKKLVISTHGKAGATALSQNMEWVNMPILESFQPIDSNGAGDSFFAGFLYAFLKGDSLIKCMQTATITSAYCVTSPHLYSEKINPQLVEEAYQRYYG